MDAVYSDSCHSREGGNAVAGWDGIHDGPTNMERDIALLSYVRPGSVAWRVYGWVGPWVSLGASQKPERALLPGCEVPWVMRPTGGKAVLHGHDLTVGLCISLVDIGLHPYSRDVEAAFLAAVGFLRDALRSCGVWCDFSDGGRIRNHATTDCFAYASPNDLVDSKGIKVCGCAQKLTDEAVLIQASIPCRAPLVDPSQTYERPGKVNWIDLDAERLSVALRESTRNVSPGK